MATFEDVDSTKTARSYLAVAATLGLATVTGPYCELTDAGEVFVATGDQAILREGLCTRVVGVTEIMQVTRRPQTVGAITDSLRVQNIEWSGRAQIRHRLRWMVEAGLITRRGSTRPVFVAVTSEATG